MGIERTIALALLILIGNAVSAAPERTLLATPPRALQNFELTGQRGEPVRLEQFRGAPLLVFFGFSHCPSVCPAALHQLKQLERDHGKVLGKTRILIVSVDGDRDSPQVLEQWLAPISRTFVGATAAPSKVRTIASQLSAAFYKTPGESPEKYLVEHSSQIFLIDGAGHLRATFFNAPTATIATVTQSVL